MHLTDQYKLKMVTGHSILLSSGAVGLLISMAIIGIMIFSAVKDRNLLYRVYIIM
jgi:hypothetical protein